MFKRGFIPPFFFFPSQNPSLISLFQREPFDRLRVSGIKKGVACREGR
jgi:hypothetical protein